MTTTPDAAADALLVARLAAGDERALGVVYDRFATLAYSLALAMLKEPADAEETVSDVFAQAWRSAAGFDASRGSLQGWIATITRSRALDRLRSRRRAATLLDAASRAHENDQSQFVSAASPLADESTASTELGERLHECLASLPVPQRVVLELAYFEGLSQSEIAERLSEPLGTVKTRVRAAMEKLRLALTPLRERGAL